MLPKPTFLSVWLNNSRRVSTGDKIRVLFAKFVDVLQGIISPPTGVRLRAVAVADASHICVIDPIPNSKLWCPVVKALEDYVRSLEPLVGTCVFFTVTFIRLHQLVSSLSPAFLHLELSLQIDAFDNDIPMTVLPRPVLRRSREEFPPPVSDGSATLRSSSISVTISSYQSCSTAAANRWHCSLLWLATLNIRLILPSSLSARLCFPRSRLFARSPGSDRLGSSLLLASCQQKSLAASPLLQIRFTKALSPLGRPWSFSPTAVRGSSQLSSVKHLLPSRGCAPDSATSSATFFVRHRPVSLTRISFWAHHTLSRKWCLWSCVMAGLTPSWKESSSFKKKKCSPRSFSWSLLLLFPIPSSFLRDFFQDILRSYAESRGCKEQRVTLGRVAKARHVLRRETNCAAKVDCLPPQKKKKLHFHTAYTTT